MAIVSVITTNGAVPGGDRESLGVELAKLAYEAEGFAGSSIAPGLCWTFFDERPLGAFSTGAGDPGAALYYVVITAMAGIMDVAAKRGLGAAITEALLDREGGPSTPEDRNRVWVRFVDVADGDLVIGGEPGSLAHLKALVASHL